MRMMKIKKWQLNSIEVKFIIICILLMRRMRDWINKKKDKIFKLFNKVILTFQIRMNVLAQKSRKYKRDNNQINTFKIFKKIKNLRNHLFQWNIQNLNLLILMIVSYLLHKNHSKSKIYSS